MVPETFGRYEIRAELGRGGMATVYLAYDPELGRKVALKVLPREFMHDPTFLERFKREAHTIARLEHQAIVPLYDFGEQDGQPYIVMRYMSSGSLADRLTNGPLDLDVLLSVTKRVCAALEKAHAAGVVHRDLKPGNILFDAEGAAYLSDFGIARLAEQTKTVTMIGTPQYMAPEQAHGQPVDARTDVYQMGVVLFRMLSGRVPFDAETTPALLHQHAYEPVPSIIELAPALPPSFDSLIRRAMAKEKEERYQSALAFSNAVERAISGAPLPEATIVGGGFADESSEAPVLHAQTKSSNRSLMYAGLIVLAVVLGGGIFFLGNRNFGGQEPTEVPVLAAVEASSTPTTDPGAISTETPAPTTTPTVAPSATHTPSASPTASFTPSPTPPPAYRITNSTANVHSGPRATDPVVATLFAGDVATVLARTEDGSWFNVELRDGSRAWLAAEDGEAVSEDGLGNIAVAATIPAPAPVFVPPSEDPVPTAAPGAEPTAEPTTFSDRDGDGFPDESDDCPDEYGVSERGGCPFRDSDDGYP